MGIRVIRAQIERLAIAGDRLLQTILVFERIAQIVPAFGMARLPPQCLAAAGLGLVEAPAVIPQISQVAPGLGEVGPQAQRLAAARLRFLPCLFLNQNCGEVGIRSSVPARKRGDDEQRADIEQRRQHAPDEHDVLVVGPGRAAHNLHTCGNCFRDIER